MVTGPELYKSAIHFGVLFEYFILSSVDIVPSFIGKNALSECVFVILKGVNQQ